MTKSRRPKDDFPRLAQFLGGYLHQDWIVEYPSAQQAVDAFAHDEPLVFRREARSQLVQLLQWTSDEEDLRLAVEALGAYYRPSVDGLTYRQWLTQVEEYLREHES